MYPPFTNNDILTQWQQDNAVPPLTEEAAKYWEPYFTQWKAELGDKALLDGINVFPINMVGHDDDFMLRLNENNCVQWQKELKDNREEMDPFL